MSDHETPEVPPPPAGEEPTPAEEPRADEAQPAPPPPPEPPPSEPPPTEPVVTRSSSDGGDSGNRTLMIVLSYLWVFALIPLLVEEDDPEVQWHAKNGLVLTGAEILFWLAIALINAASGFVGCLLMPLYMIAWIVILGLHIACMVKGVKGERLVIPGISQYADRF